MTINIKNKISIVFLSLIFVFSLSISAYPKQAIILCDQELDNISAAGFDIDINAAYAFRSAVISQSNIAAIASFNGSINHTKINNSNLATVKNQGNSAVASQSNIAAIVAESGDIKDAIIKNTNIANVENNYTSEGGAQLNTASFDTTTSTVKINNVSADASSVVAQTNIAAVVALDGNIKDTKIRNFNHAVIKNNGDSALANQNNIAVMVASGSIENIQINNTNIANVKNTHTTDSDGANVVSLSHNGMLANFSINNIVTENSASVSQSNISAVISFVGNIKNDSIKGKNIAHVVNIH